MTHHAKPAPSTGAEGLLDRHGHHAVSLQMLGPGYRYWLTLADGATVESSLLDIQLPSPVIGVVGYADAVRHRVVAGAPVASDPKREVALCHRFIETAERQRQRVCLFGVERPRLDAWREQGLAMDAVKIGAQPEWDPRHFAAKVAASRDLRYQLGRARRKGVRIRKVPGALIARNGATRRAAKEVHSAWLSGRAMAPMVFLAGATPFWRPYRRRYLFAEMEACGSGPRRIVGFASMLPIAARRGWLIEQVVRHPAAPNGTAELLIDGAMRWAADGGARLVTLGLAPLAGAANDHREPAWARLAFALSYRYLGGLYNFDGLHRFKAKLAPDRWTDLMLAGPRLTPGALLATLVAFTDGRPLRFATRSALRMLRSPAFGPPPSGGRRVVGARW